MSESLFSSDIIIKKGQKDNKLIVKKNKSGSIIQMKSGSIIQRKNEGELEI